MRPGSASSVSRQERPSSALSKRQRPVTASGKRPSSARGQRPGSAGGMCHSTTFAHSHLIPIINDYNTMIIMFIMLKV